MMEKERKKMKGKEKLNYYKTLRKNVFNKFLRSFNEVIFVFAKMFVRLQDEQRQEMKKRERK
jgi:hypothetical protein